MKRPAISIKDFKADPIRYITKPYLDGVVMSDVHAVMAKALNVSKPKAKRIVNFIQSLYDDAFSDSLAQRNRFADDAIKRLGKQVENLKIERDILLERRAKHETLWRLLEAHRCELKEVKELNAKLLAEAEQVQRDKKHLKLIFKKIEKKKYGRNVR